MVNPAIVCPALASMFNACQTFEGEAAAAEAAQAMLRAKAIAGEFEKSTPITRSTKVSHSPNAS